MGLTKTTIMGSLAGIAVLLLLPDLVQRSMDFDAALYTGLAKSATQASFWELPGFAQDSRFIDHPPLGLWLLSAWLYGFQNAWFAPALWVLLLTATSFFILHHLDRQLPAWQIGVLWLLAPVTLAVLPYPYLELPLTACCLVALWCGQRAWQEPLWAVAAGIATFAAVLIKGPVGLFPLALPLAQWYLHGNFKRALLLGLLTGGALVAALALTLLSSDAARQFTDAYLQQQVWASLSGQRDIHHDRADLAIDIARHIAVLGFITWLVALRLPGHSFTGRVRQTRYWLLLAACASLPMLASSRNYPHYLFPAIPLLVLALANWRPWPAPELHNKAWLAVPATLGVLALLIGWQHWGQPGRHQHHIANAALVAQVHQTALSQQDTEVTLSHCDGFSELRLRAYLLRDHSLRSAILTDPTPSVIVFCDHPNPALLSSNLLPVELPPHANHPSGVYLWRSEN